MTEIFEWILGHSFIRFFVIYIGGIILILVLWFFLNSYILNGISWAWAATHPWIPCSDFGSCSGPGGLGP